MQAHRSDALVTVEFSRKKEKPGHGVRVRTARAFAAANFLATAASSIEH
jgi:hypothetical protein